MTVTVIETAENKSKERFKIIPASYLVLKNDKGEYLLAMRQNTGFADGLWALPAGHFDGGETSRECIRREAKEELGIDIHIDDMKVILTVHRINPSRESVDFYILAEKWSGTLVNNEPHKCAELKFFPINELPENIIPYEVDAFAAIKNGETYIEHGW